MSTDDIQAPRGTASRRSAPRIFRSDRFLIARLEDGAVVLDEESRSIFELLHAAADAFDVLSDIPSSPGTEANVNAVRRALRGLRRELFGERMLGPEESVSIDGPDGERLFRRYPEPGRWREPQGPSSAGSKVLYARALHGDAEPEDGGQKEEHEPSDSSLVQGALVQLAEGAILLQGAASMTAKIAHAFERLRFEAIGRDNAITVGLLPSADQVVLHSRWWPRVAPALESWTIDMTQKAPLKVSRHTPTRALLKLLQSTVERPTPNALLALASCATVVPNFGITGSSDSDAIAAAIARDYGDSPYDQRSAFTARRSAIKAT